MGDPLASASAVNWPAVQIEFSLEFPADYREFIDAYGPGEIGEIRIPSPEGHGRWNLGELLARKNDQGIALPVYPEPGGIVSWGETGNGYTLSWAPVGADPDGWLVVVIGPGPGIPYFALKGARSFSAALRDYINPESRNGLIPTSRVRGAVRFTQAN
jgi:hypothetical protein